MNHYKICRKINVAQGILALLLLTLLNTHAIAANLPLEIFQPQPNLDTQNRFYKAYPDLEYNVRLAVVGGKYPYQFSLTNSPQGMTINTRGEIKWSTPQASSTPYQVTASVTDSESVTRNVSWTITVTTTGFLFVDAINGKTKENGGTGAILNPWKTMKDVYGGDVYDSKWSSHRPGYFVYWRKGTYVLDAYLEDCAKEEGCRVPWSGRQPLVWLAYPGEKPEINFNSGGRTGYIFFYDNVKNVYLDGFDFNLNSNQRGKGIAIGNSGNITVRRNIFRGLTNCSHPGSNASQLFLTGGSGQYSSIQDNTASESCGYWLLGYSSPKTIVENNHISTNIPLPISPKTGNQNWTIRGNRIQGQTTRGAIWIQDFGSMGNIEINFNLIQMSGDNGIALKLLSSNPSGPIYVNRNTFVGHVDVDYLKENKGPWTLSRNVIINSSASSDKITRNGTTIEERLLLIDNLNGSSSDNIIDLKGEFTPAYQHLIGVHGHQVGSRPSRPEMGSIPPE